MIDRDQALLQCSQQLHRAKTRAAEFEHASRAGWRKATELQDECDRLLAANLDCINHFNAIKAERDALLTVAKELQESAAYWSEYDVPLGIVDRLNAAIAKVTP